MFVDERYNIQAEQAILAIVLCDPSTSPEVWDAVDPRDFSSERSQIIAEELRSMWIENEFITTIALADRLAKKHTDPKDWEHVKPAERPKNLLDVAGGLHALVSLMAEAVPCDHQKLAKIVHEKARMRRFVEACRIVGNEPEGLYNGRFTEYASLVKEAAQDAQRAVIGPPLPLDEPPKWDELPRFPLHCLPPWLRRWCESLAISVNSAPELAGVYSLSMLSAALAGKVVANPWQGYSEQCSLYTITVAGSGLAKSPVWTPMMQPITAFQKEKEIEFNSGKTLKDQRRKILSKKLANAIKAEEDGAGPEAREEVMRELDSLGEERQSPLRIYSSNITSETCVEFAQQNENRCAILSDEAGFLKVIDGTLYGGGVPNLEIFLKGYTGSAFAQDRKSRDGKNSVQIFNKGCAITMGVFFQPQYLVQMGNIKGAHDDGFLARFLFAFAPTVPYQDTYGLHVPTDVTESYHERMGQLLRIPTRNPADPEEPYKLRFSNASQSLHRAQRQDVLTRRCTSEFQNMIEWGRKYPGTICRIAALLHCAERVGDYGQSDLFLRSEIQSDTYQRALEIAEFFTHHAKAAYEFMGTQAPSEAADAKTLIRWASKRTGRFTWREAQARFSGKDGWKPERINATLQFLADRRWIRESNAKNRTSSEYEVLAEYHPEH